MIYDIALLGSMSGSLLIASSDPKKRIAASIIWFIANCIWMYSSIESGNTQQSILWVWYNTMCILTFYNNYKLIKKDDGKSKK